MAEETTYDSLPFLQLIWKKGMCYASFGISQNHIPNQQKENIIEVNTKHSSRY